MRSSLVGRRTAGSSARGGRLVQDSRGPVRVDAPRDQVLRERAVRVERGARRLHAESLGGERLDLAQQPRAGASLEAARVPQERPVLLDRRPRARRCPPCATRGRPQHRRRPTRAPRPMCSICRSSRTVVARPVAIGLVHDEHVGDLEDAGLRHLDGVAPARARAPRPSCRSPPRPRPRPARRPPSRRRRARSPPRRGSARPRARRAPCRRDARASPSSG